ncbi:hypothetical protein K466DRAFT_565179 [Polyporus arcularius HHB13444]|uniref:Uncharacterized protein n=1 Tax=Polyporus arcularius HHB13444 TaxID=1314778 RepID=A0A5C3PFD8_9APHY|nr:hypothetical protein K466DRAFT_565179 [Polyporus arcularius HHB13444]
MRTTFFAVLFLSLLALVSATSPSRRRESNAQRLARGLAPARPRRLYDASRTNVARAAPSSVPGTVDTGVIKIYTAGTDVLLGYVGRFGFTSTLANAWHYVYTVPESPGDLVSIRDTTGYFWIGPVSYGGTTSLYQGPSVTLGPADATAVVITNNQGGATTVGATHGTYTSGNGVGSCYAQNTVWRVDETTLQMFPNWVNTDGTVSPQYILTTPSNDELIYLTGSVPAFEAANAGEIPVDLYFQLDS